MVKRILSMVLGIIMIFQLDIVPARAASYNQLSTEDLFLHYPMYLDNDKMRTGLSTADDACQRVISSYGKTSSFVAAIMTALKENLSIPFRECLAECGITDSYYEKIQDKAIRNFLKNYLEYNTAVEDVSAKIKKGFEVIKTTTETAQAYNKQVAIDTVKEACKEYFDALEIQMSQKDVDKLVDEIYGSPKLKKTMKTVDRTMKIWEYTLETIQLYSFDCLIVDDLIQLLEQCGQENFELYSGLKSVQNRLKQQPEMYILESYGSKKVVSTLAKNAEKLLYSCFDVSSPVQVLTSVACTVMADYIYQNAKADELIQATMQLDYGRSLQICMNEYKLRFMRGEASKGDIEKYQELHDACLSAYVTSLDFCRKICKMKDTYSLGGDCMMAKTELQETYTYDNYIIWCKEAASKHDSKADCMEPAAASQNCRPVLSISGETLPGVLEQGGKFGIRGEISANPGVIVRIYGAILDANGNKIQTALYTPYTKSDNLRYSINTDLIFGDLVPGSYIYTVSATAQNAGLEESKELIRHDFIITSCETEPVHESISKRRPNISLRDATYPDMINQGENFGIRGIVSSDCGIITEVYGAIIDTDENTVQKTSCFPGKSSDDLRYSINPDLMFESLVTGTYIYVVTATAQNAGMQETVELIRHEFTVIAVETETIQETIPEKEPSISLQDETYPDKIYQGDNFGIRGIVSCDCGVITEIYGAILDENGNEVQHGQYFPGTSADDLRYSINNDLIFDWLSVGSYTYRVVVTAQNINSTATVVLIDRRFCVVANKNVYVDSEGGTTITFE